MHAPTYPLLPAHHHLLGRLLPLLMLAAWLVTASPWAAAQQTLSTPAPVVPAATQAAPQRMSPEAQRDSATAPGSLRPERAALPQLTVPVGVPPAEPSASAPRALLPGTAASAGGIGNAVARCEAKISALERRQCRRQLAQQSPTTR